jgi:D-threo-aldose 1-dehydrogenase
MMAPITVQQPFHDILPRGMMPLGFGCGGLQGASGRRESVRLLETAFDCGITYFDTARMYGLGAAESILGELASRSRHRMVIASKAGILPANRSIPMRFLNRGLRLLHKAVPRSARYLPIPAATQLRFHVFSPSALRSSVDTSLKELRTDYVDILLLHECSAADVRNPQVLEVLQSLKKEGKIRAFGLATGIEETIEIATARSPLARVIQIPSSILDMNIARLPARDGGLTVVHSCLMRRLDPLLSRLSSDNLLAKRWLELTGVDPHDATSLAQLLLAHALRSNPGGVVLFSSSKPANISSNVRVAREPLIGPKQVEAVNLLLSELIASLRPA